MLEIYTAVSFQGILTGNKTNPLLVLVEINNEHKPFIIKMFNQQNEVECDGVNREVMGSILAAEFGFDVPGSALIDISSVSFERSITNEQILNKLRSLKIRLAFGTEYLYPSIVYFSNALNLRLVQQRICIPSLFAFDVMIRNTDRSFRRPNLIIHSERIYLIDFESSFQFRKHMLNDTLPDRSAYKYYHTHVFRSLLSAYEPHKKENAFDRFMEQLERIDMALIAICIGQLKTMGFLVHNSETALHCLEKIRENKISFHDTLKSLIYE